MVHLAIGGGVRVILAQRFVVIGLSLVALLALILGAFFASDFFSRPKLIPYSGSSAEPGSIISAEHVGSYPPFVFGWLIRAGGIDASVPMSERPHIFRITYWSRLDGHPVQLSGIISLPATKSPRGVVIWMHGTSTDRARSPSAPSLNEGILLSGAFAGAGYIYLAPDLPGLGVSVRAQPYLYNPATKAATLDLLQAAESFASDTDRAWPNDVYVAGFSQGGQATAVVSNALESLDRPNWRLRASAGIAGAYDLLNISFPFALTGNSVQHSIYLTLLARSYADAYGHPVTDLLTEEVAEISEAIALGRDVDAAQARLPTEPRELFQPEFLAAYDAGQPHWFLKAMTDNSVIAWAPRAPYRAYYGETDVDVSPEDSIRFADRARSLGGDATAISVGPVDHFGSVALAAPKIREWFDELSTTGDGAKPP